MRLSASNGCEPRNLKTIMPQNVRLTSRDVPLIQLGVHQCRFPVSEDPSVPGGYRFCAGATSPDRVYCDHHHTIVTAVDPRRARPGLQIPQRRAA
ncbi:GcrA family cell cycle regulator [Mesorhizobium neociceri]|uniref:GcrA cell cycle regulator n=1 Tax=Mesorhizobium neociceri TaxID=1307853 RepID=A0A838BDY1_9HYPH|nr:hypothetical protein [Mesorhizobium neociceri]